MSINERHTLTLPLTRALPSHTRIRARTDGGEDSQGLARDSAHRQAAQEQAVVISPPQSLPSLPLPSSCLPPCLPPFLSSPARLPSVVQHFPPLLRSSRLPTSRTRSLPRQTSRTKQDDIDDIESYHLASSHGTQRVTCDGGGRRHSARPEKLGDMVRCPIARQGAVP